MKTTISSEVLSIVRSNPGLTVGEIYQEYKKRKPDTCRSRNDIAKRVTDLYNSVEIYPAGGVTCTYSGKTVLTWFSDGFSFVLAQDIVTKRNATAQMVAAPMEPESVEAKASEFEPTTSTPDFVQHMNDLLVSTSHAKVLEQLRSRCNLVSRFSYLLPKRMVRQNNDLRSALDFAIDKLRK